MHHCHLHLEILVDQHAVSVYLVSKGHSKKLSVTALYNKTQCHLKMGVSLVLAVTQHLPISLGNVTQLDQIAAVVSWDSV